VEEQRDPVPLVCRAGVADLPDPLDEESGCKAFDRMAGELKA